MILQQGKKNLRSAFRAFHIVAHLVIVPFFYVDKSKVFHVLFFFFLPTDVGMVVCWYEIDFNFFLHCADNEQM